MQWAAASIDEQSELCRIQALGQQHAAEVIAHLGVQEVEDFAGHFIQILAQRFGQSLLKHVNGPLSVELHFAPQEVVLVQEAEDEVYVPDRYLR